MRELIKSVSKLREMAQFPGGMTFADMLNALRGLDDEFKQIWPWVPFGIDGGVLCSPFPVPEHHDYELLFVHIPEPVRFPDNETLGFGLAGITQHIKAIDGQVRVTTPDSVMICTPDSPVTVPPGVIMALDYDPGLYLFRQTPRIADANDFTFERLK